MKNSRRLGFVLAVSILTVAPAAMAVVCIAPDDGSGTAQMPPGADPGNSNCTTGYVSPSDLHMIIDGLPAGTTIEIGPEHSRFININGTPGGPLGGGQEQFDSSVTLQLTGTGSLDGYTRTLTIPLQCQTATGPRNPGDPVQTFPNEMVQLQGSLFGDPDFDELHIRAGSGLGLPPSPGQTTLTRLGPPGSDFNVDSFFDITYEIEFIGAPGGPLAGAMGVTQDIVRMQIGDATQATPAAGWPAMLIAALALAFLVPIVMYFRRVRTA